MASAPPGPRTDLDLDYFRQILESEQKRLLEQIEKLNAQAETGGTSGEISELADYDQHMADQGTETFLREQEQAILIGLQTELRQVEQAIERLNEGTYGYCARCGAPIPGERLEILPFAIYCIRCSSEIESRF